MSFFFEDLANIVKPMPTRASTGLNEEGFKSFSTRLSLEIPPRLRIHAVTVVPILAPMITPMDCRRVMTLELTKPTTMTVVAEELWMTAVTPIPVRKPLILLLVSLPRSDFSPLPAYRSRPSPITFIPNRNRHNPPIKASTLKISNISHSLYRIFPPFQIFRSYSIPPLFPFYDVGRYFHFPPDQLVKRDLQYIRNVTERPDIRLALSPLVAGINDLGATDAICHFSLRQGPCKAKLP